MASNKIYEEIVYQINTLLKQGDLYPKYEKSIIGGKNDYKISQVFNKKHYETDWIDTIEDCIISLDNIVRNPRKFISIEEDIVDISLARSISVESIKHLSQHTNLISSVDKKTGMVLPSKILNTSKEESFAVYENRFIYTLLLKLRDFIDMRFTAIQNAAMQSGELSVDIVSEFSLDGKKVSYKMQSDANFPFDSVVSGKTKGTLSNVERVVRIKNIVSDFLSSPFAKEMRTCALVRPPITRTNVILKNPDFKKALVLWQFIETNEKMRFEIEVAKETTELSPALSDKYRSLIFLNTILLQSIAGTREMGDTLDDKKERDKVTADEYVTKNIDDYVPDDFPLLKMDINEIKRIYTRLPASNDVLNKTTQAKINAGIDRVLRQARINKLREESIAREQLIAKQLEDEKRAKRLALREEQDIKLREKREAARKRIEARQLAKEHAEELERIKAEEQRLLKEAEELRKKAEEEQIKINERTKRELERLQHVKEAEERRNAEYQKETDAAKRELDAAQRVYDQAIKAFKDECARVKRQNEEFYATKAKMEAENEALRLEGKSKLRMAEEHRRSKENLIDYQKVAIEDLKRKEAEHWQNYYEAKFKLGLDPRIVRLTEYEKKELALIEKEKRLSREIIEKINVEFSKGIATIRAEQFEQLAELARRYHTPREIQSILSAYDKNSFFRKLNIIRKPKK